MTTLEKYKVLWEIDSSWGETMKRVANYQKIRQLYDHCPLYPPEAYAAEIYSFNNEEVLFINLLYKAIKTE